MYVNPPSTPSALFRSIVSESHSGGAGGAATGNEFAVGALGDAEDAVRVPLVFAEEYATGHLIVSSPHAQALSKFVGGSAIAFSGGETSAGARGGEVPESVTIRSAYVRFRPRVADL